MAFLIITVLLVITGMRISIALIERMGDPNETTKGKKND